MNLGNPLLPTPDPREPNTPHVEPEDLMLYLLGLLAGEEKTAVEDHLQSCTACQQELAAVQADVGVYALETTEMVDVPASGRERLLQAVAGESRAAMAAPATTNQPDRGTVAIPAGAASPDVPLAAAAVENSGLQLVEPRRALSSRLVPWAGWAAAAALALTAIHFYQDRETLRGELSEQTNQLAQASADGARASRVLAALTDRSAQRVTLTLAKATAPSEPTARATYDAKNGTLVFLASHMAPLAPGKTYELWLIPADGSAPQPAGTFHPDALGNASVITPKLRRAVAAKAFGVTIEDAAGAQTPTLPILMAGS